MRVGTSVVMSQKQPPSRVQRHAQLSCFEFWDKYCTTILQFTSHLQWIIVTLGLCDTLKLFLFVRMGESTFTALVLGKSEPPNSGINSLAWDRITSFVKTQTSCGLTSFQLFVNDNFKRISFNLNKLQGYVPHLHTYKTQKMYRNTFWGSFSLW